MFKWSRCIIDMIHFQTYLLADEDIGGNKSKKAKELGYGSGTLVFVGFLLDTL